MVVVYHNDDGIRCIIIRVCTTSEKFSSKNLIPGS